MSVRFKLLRLPVEVQPSFFLVALLLAYPRGTNADELLRVGLWMMVMFVSILWHELGHAVVMRAFGRSPRIELYALGGLAHWGAGPTPKTWQRITVSLAGPVAGVALGLAALMVSHTLAPTPGSAWATLATYLIWINLLWGALNLLPMLPLDGGKIMRSLLQAATRGRGEMAAQYVSVGVGAVVALMAFRANWPWLALLSAWAAVRTIVRLSQMRAEARDAPQWERLNEAWEMLEHGERESGMKSTEEVLVAAKSDRLRAVAVEQLAWQWLLDGDVDKTRAQLAAAPASTRPSTLLRGAIALKSGDALGALPLLEEVVRKEPEEAATRLLVEAYLKLERFDDAAVLLEDERLRDFLPDDVREMAKSAAQPVR